MALGAVPAQAGLAEPRAGFGSGLFPAPQPGQAFLQRCYFPVDSHGCTINNMLFRLAEE